MIYFTGDLHGDYDRFKSKELKKLKKGDTLIVCGDFGFLWDGSKKEQSILKKIEKLKYQVLFLEGTHDNLDLIAQYPLEEWNGGKVRRISKSVLKLERGSVFTIEGKRLFVFGGGESPEMDLRTADGTWWPQELPTIEEVMFAREELAKYDNQVDCIVTHECSSTVRHFIDMDGEHTNIMTHFFDEITEKVSFKKWFFGCYHMDKVIPPRYYALFEKVLPFE